MSIRKEDRRAVFEARQSGETLASIAKRYGVSATRVSQAVAKEHRDILRRRAVLEYPDRVDALDLSTRSRNCLISAEIHTIDQLCSYTPAELLRLSNFGRKCLREVNEELGARGLSLKDYPGAKKPAPVIYEPEPSTVPYPPSFKRLSQHLQSLAREMYDNDEEFDKKWARRLFWSVVNEVDNFPDGHGTRAAVEKAANNQRKVNEILHRKGD